MEQRIKRLEQTTRIQSITILLLAIVSLIK